MMSNFQIFDFTSDFEQQSAVTIQASLWGFITQQHHLYKCKIPDYAARCIHISSPSNNKPTVSKLRKELTSMLDTIQSNMKKHLQELKEEETMSFEEWILRLNTTVASNEEHQQRHQDHDAAARIQSIS
eukprot:13379333-Ditylum_brightwellii.AAC.1